MSNFTAFQTQAIIFTDTSSGGLPPLSRSWSFPGGSITSATGATAQVTYESPGTYTVSLTVTDDNGLSNSLVNSDVLNILPSFVTSSFTKNVTVALMSQPIVFTSTSTGQPNPPNSFGWKYAGQSDSNSTWNFGSFGDWQNIPGANINDAPGTQINFTVSLATSFSPFSSTTSQSLPVQKLGALEIFYLNTTNGASGPYQTNFDIGVFNDGSSPLTTNIYGYPGDFLIYKLTVNTFDQISGFHSNDELCQIVCSGFLPSVDGINLITGYLMVTNNIYGTGDTQIQDGQYILNSVLLTPVVDLYITGDESITSLFDDYNWDLALLNEIFSYPFPVTHSAQQYVLNFNFPSSSLSKGGVDPMIPSQIYLESLGGEAYQIEISINYDTLGLISSIVTFNANGGNGNEKITGESSVDFYVAQDTSEGDGIVTTVNNFLSADLPGGTGDIIFEAGTQYSVMPDSSPSDYNGIILKVLNPDINSIVITDNSSELSSVLNQPIPPFGIDPNNLGDEKISCTGIITRLELSSYKESGYSKVSIGGSLF